MTAEKKGTEIHAIEERYRVIFENSGTIMVFLDANMTVVLVNKEFEKATGYDRAEAEGRMNCLDMVADPDDRDMIRRYHQLRRIAPDKAPGTYDLKLRIKNGDIRYGLLRVTLVPQTDYSLASIIDITERKLAEERVRDSRKMLNDTLQAASAFSIIATDINGTVTLFNRGAELMLGYTAEEMVGKKTPLDIHLISEVTGRGVVLTEELGYPVEGFRVFTAKAELEGSEVREWTYVRKDGSLLTVSLVVTVVRSDDGEITGFLGIASDITQRKKIEREARMLASIVRHSSEVVNLAHPDGRMVFINEAGANLLGIDREGMDKINVRQAIPEHQKQRFTGEILPSLNAGKNWEGELQLQNIVTGRLIDVYAQAFTIEDPEAENGRYLASVSIDISRRKSAEEKFMRIFMLSPNCIAITQQISGRIIDVNMAFEKITGWQRDEAVGRTSMDIGFWADAAGRESMVADLNAGREVIHREFRFRRKDGVLRDGIYSARSFMSENEACVIFILDDITQRKIMEKKLRENEDRFSVVMANIPGVVFQYYANDGGEEGISFSSEPMTRIFGIPTDSDDRLEWFIDNIHIDDKERFINSMRAAVSSAGPWNFEGRYLKPSGKLIWFTGISLPVREEGRTIWNGILLDITERKEGEDKFKQLAGLHQLILDTVCASITFLKDRKFQWVNRHTSQMLGYAEEEIIGKPSSLIYLNEEQFEKTGKEAYACVAGGGIYSTEIQYRKKDGNPFWVLLTGKAINPAKPQEGSIWILHDINERKNAEMKSAEVQTLYRSLVEALPDAVGLMDLEGRIKFLSPNALKLFGFEKFEDVLGTRFDLTVDPGCRDKVKEFFRNLIETGEIRVMKNISMIRNGTPWVAEASASVIRDSSGAVKEVIGIVRDVTEHKRLEEERRNLEQQLLQSQKLDAIGALAGGIAHDFNNILAGIFGYSDIAMTMVNNPVKIKYYLDKILAAGMRARDLVEQILTFSRHAETELKEIAPKYIVKEVIKLLRASIPATIEFSTDIKSDSSILGDVTKLHQIVVNLCTNAAYAMKDTKGTLEVGLLDFVADDAFIRNHPGLKPGKHLLLKVSDTGSGIPPENLDKIFEPFFTTKPQGEGTGLGLSVVHGIVRSFGGAITLSSKVGEGTTFNVFLPVVNGIRREEDAARRSDMPRGSEKILLVDDEIPVLNTMKTILKNLGYSVTAFSSGAKALDAFNKKPDAYDLIITDYTMPRLTGIDIARKVREIRNGIPVVIASGFVHTTLENEVRDVGIGGVIRKPVRIHELADIVRQVLDNKK